jgi:hypothetical protein
MHAMNKPAKLAEATMLAGLLHDRENGYPEILLHPAWRNFVRYCAELRHGEIERLSIQDGLPVLAEVTTKKVKFG